MLRELHRLQVDKLTPWQKLYSQLGTKNQSEFARMFGWDRSKVCRALKAEPGLIDGTDQATILRVCKERGIKIDPRWLLPNTDVKP